MLTKDLNSRRDKILELIVDTYIDTATPIASRTISRKLRLSLSPATIRNVMSDLEELGLITHPYTSAGRIPTQKGYRYYIDRLMHAELLTEEEKRRIGREFKIRVNELDDILEKTSNILSSVSNQTGMVLFPILQRGVFGHVELVKLNNDKLLIVLMTKSGFTKDILIDIEGGLEDRELERISNFLNSHAGKGSLSKIRKEVVQRLLAERDSFFYVLEKTKNIIDVMLDIAKENKLYLDGRMHMTEHPEFNDVYKLKSLFRRLEDKDFLLSILKKNLYEEGVRVYIGSELDEEFSDCSIITRNYCIGDASCGSLGVIGPTRMEYAKLVSMVNYVADTLSEVLSG